MIISFIKFLKSHRKFYILFYHYNNTYLIYLFLFSFIKLKKALMIDISGI
jgi:hypothetical protein